ncbi:MAG: 5'/3'-nucleotidase SurE [Planctomycetes bacterium]|nr:5'/3'-nucleotidase SurE [Planctomycetota bacterium]
MDILLTNDDSIENNGLSALYKELRKLGRVTVVSPFSQQSGVGHGITIFKPLFIRKVYDYLSCNACLYAVEGTPADCIKLGIVEILKKRPDIVVSGINDGANVGIDVFYSGTVAAAIEGAFWGIPSFAVSREKPENHSNPDFSDTAKLAVTIIKDIIRGKIRGTNGIVYNINIPCCSPRQMKGVKHTRQGTEYLPDQFVSGTDPRGRNYYWMKSGLKKFRHKRPVKITAKAVSDISAVKKKYISITPLVTNLTDWHAFDNY